MFTKNRFFFRVVFIFFILLIFPFPLSYIPGLNAIGMWQVEGYHMLIPWIGKNILHLENEITSFGGGSGDSTYDYVLVLFFLVMALIGAAVWTLLDKKKKDLNRLSYWFSTYLRYYLASNMLSYGFSKVFQMQMGEPSFYRLLEPIGDMSPMGMAWTFIGSSAGYTIFSGLAEVIPGLLLLHKRTKYLGAILLIAVMGNVVLLNMLYDIPVKLFSFECWLMAVIIAAPKLKSMMQLLLNIKRTDIIEPFKAFKGTKWFIPTRVFKWIAAAFLVIFFFSNSYSNSKKYGSGAPKPVLYGLYEVTEFKCDGETLPPNLDDPDRWRYIAMEYEGSTQFYRMNMGRFGLKAEIDTLKQEIKWSSYRDSTNVSTFRYTKTDSTMRFQGRYKDADFDIMTKRLTKDDFLLTSRGFHWIQEVPFNR